MLPVANKPILVHALNSMAVAGITDVAVAVAPDGEAIIRDVIGSQGPDGIRITYLPTDRTDSVAAVLLAGEQFVDGHPFVLQHGDGILRHDLGALLRTLPDEMDLDALLLVHHAGGRPHDPGFRLDRERALGVVAHGTPRPGSAIAGAQIFGPDFLGRAGAQLRRSQSDADVASLAARLARESASVRVCRVGGWRRFEGDPHVLLDMNRLLLDELDPRPGEPEVEGTRVEGRVTIHPSARVKSSVIRGPAVIGADACIVDAFVGPYTAIGDGARVEGAEIENSIMFPGASVLHVGARLESCVIGREARVARRFSVPQAMRLHLGDSASVLLG